MAADAKTQPGELTDHPAHKSLGNEADRSPKQRMKWMLRGLAALVIGFAIWALATYPTVGELAFQGGAATEARMYGLQKTAVDIGELQMVTYQGGPADGASIVMLHGYTADKDVWPRFAKQFLNDYRVIIPDLAGHGETGFNPQWDYSIAAQSARVADLMDTLGIEKAHVIGNSMGGFITAYFAIHYPDRTLSAAPIDPAGVISPELSDMGRALAQGHNPFLIRTEQDFADFYPMTMAQPPWLPGFVLDAMAKKYIDRREQHAHIFADFHDSVLTKDLARLQAPALLIWGRKDRLIDVSAVGVWSANVPHLQVEILDGVGHMPMVEVPKQTARIYRAFLNSL